MYTYTCIHIHIYIHIYIYTYTYTYTYTCTYTCTYTDTCMHACMHACMHTNMYRVAWERRPQSTVYVGTAGGNLTWPGGSVEATRYAKSQRGATYARHKSLGPPYIANHKTEFGIMPPLRTTDGIRLRKNRSRNGASNVRQAACNMWLSLTKNLECRDRQA